MKAKMKYVLPFSPFVVVSAFYVWALFLGACDRCHANGVLICGDTGAGYLFIIATGILLPFAILFSGIWWLIRLLIWLKKRRR